MNDIFDNIHYLNFRTNLFNTVNSALGLDEIAQGWVTGSHQFTSLHRQITTVRTDIYTMLYSELNE